MVKRTSKNHTQAPSTIEAQPHSDQGSRTAADASEENSRQTEEGTRRTTRASQPSERMADAINNKRDKQAAAALKAKTTALRERQAAEEANNFRDMSLGPESEQEYFDEEVMAELHEKEQFTINAVPDNPQPRRPHLVRRRNNAVDSDDDADVPLARPIGQGPNPNTIRRAGYIRNEAPVQAQPLSKGTNGNLVRRAGHVSKLPPRMVLNLRTTGPRATEYRQMIDNNGGHTHIPSPPPSAYRPTRGPTPRPLTSHLRSQNIAAGQVYRTEEQADGHHQIDDDYIPEPPLFYDDADDQAEVPSDKENLIELPPRGKICAAPPSTTSATTRVVKKQKTSLGGGSRGRIVVSDFGALQQAVIIVAQHHYRCKICTEWPYPEDVEEQGMAVEAWAFACKRKNIHMEFDETMLKLLTARGTQVRSELKTKARPLVAYEYGLHEGGKIGVREIRDKVENLLDGTAYAFKNPEDRTGLYEHGIIQALVNEMWYANKNDEGVVYSDYFKHGIPLVTIALILTAVQCALEEWQTGQKSDIQFTESAYRASFENHLKGLTKFEKRMKDMQVMPRIQRRLLKRARAYAKVVDEEEANVRDVVGDADLEAARREWEARGSGDEAD